jgi:phage terminase large subunit-like protein
VIDYLEEYTSKVLSGEIITGIEIKKMLRRLKQDRESGKYIFDNRRANMRIDFIEQFCKQGKQPFYNLPPKLLLWQKAFYTALYSFYRKDENGNKGKLRFQKAMLLIARKNGKSAIASFDGFCELAIGDGGQDIVCGSNDDNQASLIWKEIGGMATRFEKKPRRFHRNLSLVKNNFTDSKCFKMSSKTRDKDGRQISKAYLDEVHNAVDNELYMAIWQSMSINPEPLLIITTTEGFINDGLLDKELKEVRAMLDNEIDVDDYLAFLYTQDSENEIWQDESSWVKSNPSLDVIKKRDYLRGNIEKAKRDKASRIHTLCKDFNIHQNSNQAWLMPEDYESNKKFDLEILRGAYAICGVDLSATTDMTACTVVVQTPETNTRYVIQKYWIPERKLTDSDDKKSGAEYDEWARMGLLEICEGNEIEVDKVADWLYSLYEIYGITPYKCGYDVRLSKGFVNRMTELFGAEVLEVIPQGAKYLSEPMKLLEADLKSGIVNYNCNDILKWCLSNTQAKINQYGQIMAVKLKEQPSRRIDGAVSLIIAYATMRMYKTEYNDLYN